MNPSPLFSTFRSSLSEAWASGAGVLLPLGFFAGTAALVPFTLGSEAELLSRVGPGILWLALALSSMVINSMKIVQAQITILFDFYPLILMLF